MFCAMRAFMSEKQQEHYWGTTCEPMCGLYTEDCSWIAQGLHLNGEAPFNGQLNICAICPWWSDGHPALCVGLAARHPPVDSAARHSPVDLAARHPSVDLAARHPPVDLAARHPPVDLAARHPPVDLAVTHPPIG